MPTIQSPDMIGYRLLQKTLVFCACLVLFGVMGVYLFSLNASHERCDQIQAIRGYILDATDRGITSLPTIQYYKEHPEEKARALEDLRRQREEFQHPLDCSFL